MYFTGGLTVTGVTAALARGSRFAHMNPLWFFLPAIGGMIGCQMLDYQTQAPLKHALWGLFTVSEGLMMAPLISMASMPIIFNALAATGVMMGALGLYAYSTPTQDFLSW